MPLQLNLELVLPERELDCTSAFCLCGESRTGVELLVVVATEEEVNVPSRAHPIHHSREQLHRLVAFEVEEYVGGRASWDVEFEGTLHPALADPAHVPTGSLRAEAVALRVSVAAVDTLQAVVRIHGKRVLEFGGDVALGFLDD